MLVYLTPFLLLRDFRWRRRKEYIVALNACANVATPGSLKVLKTNLERQITDRRRIIEKLQKDLASTQEIRKLLDQHPSAAIARMRHEDEEWRTAQEKSQRRTERIGIRRDYAIAIGGLVAGWLLCTFA